MVGSGLGRWGGGQSTGDDDDNDVPPPLASVAAAAAAVAVAAALTNDTYAKSYTTSHWTGQYTISITGRNDDASFSSTHRDIQVAVYPLNSVKLCDDTLPFPAPYLVYERYLCWTMAKKFLLASHEVSPSIVPFGSFLLLLLLLLPFLPRHPRLLHGTP